MKKNISLLTLPLLVLVGCESLGTDNSESDNSKPTATLEKIKFTLPSQIKWDSVKSDKGGAVIYTPKGVAPNKTPIKFVNQYVKNDIKPSVLAEQVLKPIQDNCEKPVVNTFKTISKYPNQLSYQLLCNKFKGASIGMVSYVDIFSDATGSHLFISEVKTPASAEPGKLDKPTTEEEKKAAQNTIAFIKLAQKTMTEVTACEADDKCI